MLSEILGVLEFAGFLVVLGALCVWVSKQPAYQQLNKKIFPEVIDNDQT